MATDFSKYRLNHTMLRVKDPQRSIKFYEMLGMTVIKTLPIPDSKFDLYFLAFDSPKAISHGKHLTARQGLLELTHNYGTENDDNFKANNGNAEPGKGFGHICISVDNLQATCRLIEENGYKFQKKLTDGKMRHIAFALDPDGYWVELISFNDIKTTENIEKFDQTSWRLNHSMIRVKDPEKSLKFYQEIMGMTLLRTTEMESGGFNLYFLGYPSDTGAVQTEHPTAGKEGILELTWNYGTEKDDNFAYHNGNDQPQGFGHICVTVDDMEAACERWEAEGVNWQKRMTDGRMKNVAFILDPDKYWVEILQNEEIKSTGFW